MRFLSCIKLIWMVKKHKPGKSIERPDTLRWARGISSEKLIRAALSAWPTGAGRLVALSGCWAPGSCFLVRMLGVLLGVAAWRSSGRFGRQRIRCGGGSCKSQHLLSELHLQLEGGSSMFAVFQQNTQVFECCDVSSRVSREITLKDSQTPHCFFSV